MTTTNSGGRKPAKPAKPKGPSQASLLLANAEENYRLLLSTDGRHYAVPKTGPNIVLPLRREGGLRQQLARDFAKAKHMVASSASLTDVMTVLDAAAAEAMPEPVFLRAGEHDGRLILDLGTPDGTCVIIGTDGWEVAERSPVPFRRSAAVAPLPAPTVGGSLEDLRALLNISEEGWRLTLGWLLASFFPNMPKPILGVFGPHGSAKTTLTRIIVLLIDQTPSPSRRMTTDLDNWAVSASAHYISAFENVSRLSLDQGDALCRVATGESDERRAKYSDDDVVIIKYLRPVIINGIEIGAIPGDVADRMLMLELDAIDEDNRRPELEAWADFEKIRSGALGALLDLLAKVLKAYPQVNPTKLPRMADFGRLLCALDAVTGWNTAEAYQKASKAANEAVVDGDPVAQAIEKIARAQPADKPWSGTTTDLLQAITPMGLDGPRPPKGWPDSVMKLSHRLRRLVPAFKAAGINVTVGERGSGKGRERNIILEVVSPASGHSDTGNVGHSSDSPAGVSEGPSDTHTSPDLLTLAAADASDTPDTPKAPPSGLNVMCQTCKARLTDEAHLKRHVCRPTSLPPAGTQPTGMPAWRTTPTRDQAMAGAR